MFKSSLYLRLKNFIALSSCFSRMFICFDMTIHPYELIFLFLFMHLCMYEICNCHNCGIHIQGCTLCPLVHVFRWILSMYEYIHTYVYIIENEKERYHSVIDTLANSSSVQHTCPNQLETFALEIFQSTDSPYSLCSGRYERQLLYPTGEKCGPNREPQAASAVLPASAWLLFGFTSASSLSLSSFYSTTPTFTSYLSIVQC